MTTKRADNITIVDADLSRAEHQHALLTMLEAYMLDPMEGGVPLSAQVKRDLVPGLRAHPACYVLLAYQAGAPVGFAICFLGFSTFMARPLINIHDIFVERLSAGSGSARCCSNESRPKRAISIAAASRSKCARTIASPAASTAKSASTESSSAPNAPSWSSGTSRCEPSGWRDQSLLIRLATTVASSTGSTGLGTCIW